MSETKSIEELLKLVEKTLDGDLAEKKEDKETAESVSIFNPNRKIKKLRKSKYRNNVVKFLGEKGIKSGKVKVPTHRLFYEYRVNFQKDNRALKASSVEFSRILADYFDKYRDGRQRYFLINDVLDMSEEVMEKSRKLIKRKNGRKKENTKVEKEE